MREHRFESSLTLKLPLESVFHFFADVGNLERITPDRLSFTILSSRPIEMCKGALIDYRLSLLGIPFDWQTEITRWDPPFQFVDSQVAAILRFRELAIRAYFHKEEHP